MFRNIYYPINLRIDFFCFIQNTDVTATLPAIILLTLIVLHAYSMHKQDEYHLSEHLIMDLDENKRSLPPNGKQFGDSGFVPFVPLSVLSIDENMRHVRSQQDVKNEERQMIKNDSNASLKDDVWALQNIKGNVKNAYIKKINSLLSVNADEEKEKIIKVSESQQRLRAQKEQQSSGSSHRNVDNDELKMQKNRESARNSRQRKKLYIGLLEKKVEDLNGQIEGLRQQCEMTFKSIHGVIEQSPCLKGMIIEQAQIFEQLAGREGEQPEGSEMQSLLTDSYKLKFSATGSRRKAYIKYCFQNMAKALMEGNYGPLLFGTSSYLQRGYQVPEDEELAEYVKSFRDTTGLTEEKSQAILVAIVRRILEHKRSFGYLIKQLKQKQKSLRICQQQLEDQIEEITNQMTPPQFTALLLQINKQKTDDTQMKEEFPQLSGGMKLKDQFLPSQQQLLQYNFMQQLPDLLKTSLLIPNNLLIDPLSLNDFIQKKFCKP